MQLPDHHGDWLPLTPAQLGIFLAHELDPKSPACTTAEIVEFDGTVDVDRLARAVTSAYAEFEQLRVQLRIGMGGAEQRVVEVRPVQLAVHEAADEQGAQAFIEAQLERALDIRTGEVTRTGVVRIAGSDGAPVDWWWHAAHHVVLDGYGIQQLLRRVNELYDGAAPLGVDERPRLVELVADEHRDIASEAYWDERLLHLHGAASLSGGRVAPPAPRARRRGIELPDHLQRALTAGAKRLGATWPDLVTTAAAVYVGRVLGVEQGRIGVPLMNRTMPGVGQLLAARTVTTAVNVLPVSVDVRDLDVAGALAQCRAEQLAIRVHPFERQESLTRRLQRSADADLFGLQVNIIPFGLDLSLDGVRGVLRNVSAGPVEDLTLTLRGTPGRGRAVRLELDAHPDLYTEDELDRHLERLLAWLATWADASPDSPVRSLPLVPAKERALVTAGWNDTRIDHDAATLGARFAAQATRTPDAVALRFDDATRTYAELHERAASIALELSRRGVTAGSVVGVQLERGFDLYETIHALALLGAVYLPLDVDLPAARRDMLLEDARAQLVVTSADRFEDVDGAAASLPDDPRADLDAPAYLLFTSGSTGRPKGVLVSHRAIDNRLAWMQHRFALQPHERVLHKTPISFDVSIWELYWPLQVGASVTIAPPGVHRDPRALAALIADGQIDVLHFVPSMLRAFLADRASRDRVRSAPARVRGLVTSGEALTPDLVRASIEHFGTAPVNLYGPTEAAVDVTEWTCTAEDAAETASVPIGRPVWNTQCYVLDPELEPVGIGMTGELWLGGVQLAIGYVGREELTAERFVATPFGRLYRTGDIASWRGDGALLYHGRTDDQVKLRGQRVELGEIEAALAGVDGVAALAAGVVESQLVVWYAPDSADTGFSAEGLRAAMDARARSLLPDAWVPRAWVEVDAIPLSPSGKTDRRRLALDAPPGGDPSAQSDALPEDLVVQRIASVMADLLQRDVVPPDADFFQLGGDSLSVLHLVSRIDDEFGTELGIAEAFAHPTAAALARSIARDSADRAAPGDDFARVLTLRTATGGANGPGHEAPLFLLPPAGGLGWCYTNLLAGLPPGMSVYAIQAPGLRSGRPELVLDLDALAERELEVIRSVVGDGPFHLAGWSLGGMTAHAIASLARSQGTQVASVTLLDAFPAEQWHGLPDPTEGDARIGILRLAGIDPPDDEVTHAEAIRLLRTSGSALAQLPDDVLTACLASVRGAARIMRASTTPVLDGDMTVVVADAPRAETNVDVDGWRAHVAGELRIVRLDATHNALVRRPVASEVTRILATAAGVERPAVHA